MGTHHHGGGEIDLTTAAIQLPDNQKLVIARILKVNHAGEHGAIQIYGAQISIAKIFYPEIVAKLTEMQSHEIGHHRLFAEAMLPRQAKPCRLLFLWSIGGWSLGIAAALMGKKMIWTCTEAVESAVHDHLVDQLAFLATRDTELHDLIKSIQIEEDAHLHHAKKQRGASTAISTGAVGLIKFVTDVLIWMSTSGDSSRLKSELRNEF